MDVNLSELWELVMNREVWRAAIHGVAKSRTRLSNGAELPDRQAPSTAHSLCVSSVKDSYEHSGWEIRGFEQLLLLSYVSKLLQTIVQKFPRISGTAGSPR